MTARRRRTVIVSVAALLVAFMLVPAATTGPSGVIGDLGAHSPSSGVARDETPRPAVSKGQVNDSPPDVQRATDWGGWLRDALWFSGLVLGLVLAAGVLRAVSQHLGRDLSEKQLVLDLDPPPDIEAAREALLGFRKQHEAALAAPEVRNGIVACWVLLEEAASHAGVTRQPAETATEFVIRFLHALDVDPRPVAALATLYQEARFSTHDLPVDARSQAEQALRGIHADLDRSVAT